MQDDNATKRSGGGGVTESEREWRDFSDEKGQ